MRTFLARIVAGLFLLLFVFLPTSSSGTPPKDSEFVYARIRYHLTLDGQFVYETPWHHDYPDSDSLFPKILAEITGVRSNGDSYQIVDIDSPDLFKYPFYYLCEPGYIDLLPRDAANLREYLDRGGFVLVDDFRTASYSPQRGVQGYEDDIGHFRREMKKVYPDREFEKLTLKDPIFHTFYDIQSLDVNVPYVFPGQLVPEFLVLRDDKGHIQMILNNNNDVSEEWKWVNQGRSPMHDALTSLQFGINYVMYAMTH